MFSRDEKENPGPVVCRRAPDTDWPDSSSTTPARISPCSKRTRYSAGQRLNSYRCQSITLGACPSPEIQTRTRLNSFPASGTSAFPSTSVVRSIRGELVSVRPSTSQSSAHQPTNGRQPRQQLSAEGALRP